MKILMSTLKSHRLIYETMPSLSENINNVKTQTSDTVDQYKEGVKNAVEISITGISDINKQVKEQLKGIQEEYAMYRNTLKELKEEVKNDAPQDLNKPKNV